MKKTIIALLGAAALTVAVPATASASVHCDTGRSPVTYTAGGYEVVMTRYTSVRGMQCSSVRYVINNWLRRQVARQYGWPRLGRPFFDGYVTWHGRKVTGTRWRFKEYTTGTVFEFTGYVR